MLLFRDKEPAFLSRPLAINEKKNGMLPLRRRAVRKKTRQQKYWG